MSILHPIRHAITLNEGAGLCSLLGFAGSSHTTMKLSHTCCYFCLEVPGLRSRVLSQNHVKVSECPASQREVCTYVSLLFSSATDHFMPWI